jgi:peptide/nickel transport system substrate-binding protein
LERAGFKTLVGDVVAPMIHVHGACHHDAAGMPLGDVRVRRALSLAINRDEINSVLFYGKAGPPLPSRVVPYASDIDSARWTEWATDNLVYDPQEARRLIDEAGYPRGFSFKLYVYAKAQTPYIQRLAEMMRGYWKAIGIDAQIVPIKVDEFDLLRKRLAPQLAGQASVHSATSNPMAGTPLRQGFGRKGGFRLLNVGATESAMPQIDSLLDQADTEPDPENRGKLLDRVIEKTAPTYTAIQIVSAPSVYGYGPRVEFPADTPMPIKGFGMIVDMIRRAT